MKKNFLSFLCALCILTLSSFVFSSKTNDSNNEITNCEESSFYYVVDNRYNGGSDAFIELFKKHVYYPQEAFDNCRVGLSKIKLTVSKDGQLENVEFTNQLGMGIEKRLEAFFEESKENWKSWARSSVLEMTVGFSLITKSDSYYPDADLLILEKSAFKYSTKNEYCDSDSKIEKRVKKYIKKKKYNKAISFAEELLRRHPDNSEFQENHKLIKSKMK